MTTASPIQPTSIHGSTPRPAIQPILSSSLDTSTKNTGAAVPRGPVTASLNFYKAPADGSKPFNYVEKPPEGEPQRNYGDQPTSVTINDIRGRESSFNLQDNAFQALEGVPSAVTDWTSDAHIRDVYYPEVEALLLNSIPGAQRVLLFDHTIRRAEKDAHRAPVARVHVDQTPKSADQRVRFHLPAEADALLRGRVRIVNVWRPLNGPVVSFPLAVADSATARDEDLVGVEHRYPDRTGETASVRHHEGQKWYYWSGMTNDERLLLKCYDSDEAVADRGRVPHTAFTDERTPEGAPGRQSIEVRALVFG
ncbi:hypothetical protein BDY21DRAFT_283419 [Lineolata rhizophorae]|uniref:Methyltransferase n=1 Tax=Lineolata rhizophorae TaxID=578093 RepID=A0A6A6P4I4_9PEZI|nr:hypothetical protein BDY21DRAFT_283419 [Lineolata rhizophorae]